MKLYCARHGEGQKILFLHGAGGSSSSWHLQEKYLQRCAEVVVLDLPGRGASGGSGFSSIAEYVRILLDFIEGNQLQGCYLADHSMGGLIALCLALARPELFSGLVLVATGARLRVSSEILE